MVNLVFLVMRFQAVLPLQIEDAGRSEAEIAESEKKAAGNDGESFFVRSFPHT